MLPIALPRNREEKCSRPCIHLLFRQSHNFDARIGKCRGPAFRIRYRWEDSSRSVFKQVRTEFLQQNFHDSFRRMSIPQLRSSSLARRSALQNTRGRRKNFLRIPSHDLIRPLLHSHRTFRIFPKRQARHSQNRALLLNSSRIGEVSTAHDPSSKENPDSPAEASGTIPRAGAPAFSSVR